MEQEDSSTVITSHCHYIDKERVMYLYDLIRRGGILYSMVYGL